MKNISPTTLSKANPLFFAVTLLLSIAFVLATFSIAAIAQPNQLMLADILIGLRSKKATLPERNKILAEAVVVRGVTFALTPEIEKELSDTGADKNLIDSIRQKSKLVKVVAIVNSSNEVKPKAEPVPPPPDFSFYEKQGGANVSKGDFDAAVSDYTIAIELNPSAATAFFGRGIAYFNKKSYDLAITDYNKLIELTPKNAAAIAKRGEAYEKNGNTEQAVADYKKVIELDPANEAAKATVSRLEAEQAKALQAEQAKALKKPDPIVVPPTVTAPVIPEFVNLGLLTRESAVRMTTPIYPLVAMRSKIGGKVVVDVTLDTEGNVTSAQVSSGSQFLKQASVDAALKSKFKPAMVGTAAVKAKGYIVYNYTPPL